MPHPEQLASEPGPAPHVGVAGDIPERIRVADHVYDLLRRSIFDHRLRPGARLSVPSIATELGVSRSPVREAVQRLVRDGLATEEPHKGAVVTTLGATELVPLYEVREVLEGLAARLAAERASRGQLAELRRALNQHSDALDRGDVEGHIAADVRFHAIVREAAGNADLAQALERIEGKVVIAILSGDVHRWPIRALAEHTTIFDALVAGDAVAAERAARAHIARIRTSIAEKHSDAEPDEVGVGNGEAEG
jgi:DNA-binding GntR family transcriptional regulator